MGKNFILFLVCLGFYSSRCIVKADFFGEDMSMAELPLKALLSQKKAFLKGNLSIFGASDSKSVISYENNRRFLDITHKLPEKKSFHENKYEDQKRWISKKKENSKIHDILYTSVTTLSYLAFGGYLLCVIVGALREKRRLSGIYAYPVTPPDSQGNAHFTHILQQYFQRPIRIRFPKRTVNYNGKKKRESSQEQHSEYYN